AERTDRELDVEPRGHIGRPGPARDHDDVPGHLFDRRSLAHVDASLGSPADELAGDRGGVGHAVLTADDGGEDVARAEAGDVRRVDALDRNAELALQLGALRERGGAARRRGEEQVADLTEVPLAELDEEANALLGEADLGRGRELLADAAH